MNRDSLPYTFAVLTFAGLLSSCNTIGTDGGIMLPRVELQLSATDLTEMRGEEWIHAAFLREPELRQRFILFEHTRDFEVGIWKAIGTTTLTQACTDIRLIFGKTEVGPEIQGNCVNIDLLILRPEVFAKDCAQLSAYGALTSTCESCGVREECERACLRGKPYFVEPSTSANSSGFPSLERERTFTQSDSLCSGLISPADQSQRAAFIEGITTEQCDYYCETVMLDRTRCRSTTQPEAVIGERNAPTVLRVLQALAPISYLVTSDGERYTQWLKHSWDNAMGLDAELARFLQVNSKVFPPRRFRAFGQRTGSRFDTTIQISRALWINTARIRSAYQSLLRNIESTCGVSTLSRPSSESRPEAPSSSKP